MVGSGQAPPQFSLPPFGLGRLKHALVRVGYSGMSRSGRKALSGVSKRALQGLAAAFALTAGAPALAQTSTTEQDETLFASNEEETPIIVMARRRAENVQDVPIAITTLSGADIESAGAYRLDQIKQLVPSAQTLTFNPRNTNLSIRGLGANVSLANDGFEQGVGFYVDDVYYGRPGQTQFDLVDIQQFEVLRGPQGTLFGKNTTAGAINVTTRAPSFGWQGSLEASIGDYGYHQERGSISGPLIEDKLAFRATIAATHRDGFIENAYNGDDLFDYNNLTSRLQVLVEPTERLSIRVIADYGTQAQNCCVGVAAGTAFTRIDGTPLPNDFYARAARIGYTPLPIDPRARRVDVNSPVRTEMWQGGLSTGVDYDLDSVALTSITAYRWWDWEPQNDADGTSRSANIQGRIINNQRQFSQEFRLASQGENTVDWVAGLYYFWQEIPGRTTLHFGPDAALFNLPPVLYPTPEAVALASAALDDYELFAYSNPETRSSAAFAQGTWNINDQFRLTGGLRYTYEEKDGVFDQRVVGGTPLSDFPVAAQAYVTTIRNLIGGANSYQVGIDERNLSGLFTASYDLSPDLLTYATYSRGNKSGGLNLSNLPASVPRTVDPETVDHYEAGLKSTWADGAITANVAAFWTEIDGYQTTLFDSDRVTTYISNVGTVRSRGIELDSRFRWDGFTAYAAVTYNEAVFVDYPRAPPPVEYTGLLPQSANYIDLSDRPIPGAPRWAASVGGEWEGSVPSVEGVRVFAGADYSYRSSFYASANNARSSLVGDYALLNARAGLRSEDGKTELTLWVRNAGDTLYFETLGGGNAGASGLVTGVLGAPRTYGLTLRRSFGS